MTAAHPLTPRQRAVVKGIADGLSCPQIARRLGISVRTVRQHIENIAKLLPGPQPPIRRIAMNASNLLAA